MRLHATLPHIEAPVALHGHETLVHAIAAIRSNLSALAPHWPRNLEEERSYFLSQAINHEDLELRIRAWDAWQARIHTMPPAL